ncbi:glycogen/starch/alpha-glucan phosphorylase [Endozoicomonas sp. SCSIO W0465]|uniref:glycogen/starch/alpha-glucan phosphorylase n=1 Tax=Endozoicomonas sp. SCSIO W0465 TaxID=2918516 RepID=UPI0020760740|nr:glycogen/starch/alpha-glucan phosphorylase [Endozoicomonas sp. SCSIO W0465]USE38488.1 glycogen/starch/alpha-glucan phosphorylase [Endozoicomonas sp. SCSIO W0465]
MGRTTVDLSAVGNMDTVQIEQGIRHHLEQSLGVDLEEATPGDYWEALSLLAREINLDRTRYTRRDEKENGARRVYYLSLEFMVGRLLGNNLHNLGIYEQTEKAMASFGVSLSDVLEYETDPALGNGGLGRLAACFLDSLTTLNVPAFGYGINYRFGLFKQGFVGGKQVESPDAWREDSFPWGIEKPKRKQVVRLYGTVREVNGNKRWEDTQEVLGVPWDLPITGYNTARVNTLRLWEGRATEGFDLDSFDAGRYQDSRFREILAENISQVLYPNDSHPEGKELRLIQQYFFVACSLADLIARYKREHEGWEAFTSKVVIQLNDTHPAIAVPELLRILMDEEDFVFTKALEICRSVFCYTNHTLLPEALETWPQGLIARVLPRHMQLIYKLNYHFLNNEVEKQWPGDHQMKSRLSIIEEPTNPAEPQMVRMAYLSVIGSHKVNGVAALHTMLVKAKLFPEFDQLWPEKIVNVTNGVTPRRWVANCNPALAELIDQTLNGDWRGDLAQLSELKAWSDDPQFQEKYARIKLDNKKHLTDVIANLCGVKVNPEAIFDVQIKRLHEYKRQQMNLLHIMAIYRRLLQDPDLDVPHRVFIFAAKAAPGYLVAKNIIYAINRVADRVNNDRRIRDKLKVVFLPNYRVSLAEKIIPAANVSEQISTAGFEASGTGNMKFALNGALTIGTLDGANVEIAEEVGEDNIFIFGKTVDEVSDLRQRGYHPRDIYQHNEELKAVIDWLASGDLSPDEPGAFRPLVESLLDSDYFLTLADYQSYSDAHDRIVQAWKNPPHWWRMAIINTASMGKFSSDRSIVDYCRTIWDINGI